MLSFTELKVLKVVTYDNKMSKWSSNSVHSVINNYVIPSVSLLNCITLPGCHYTCQHLKVDPPVVVNVTLLYHVI